MCKKILIKKLLLRFLGLLHLSTIIICSNNIWNYKSCKAFLNTLNITCTKFHSNEIINICENWEATNITGVENIPEECQNKKYILTLLVKKSNQTTKKDIILFIKKQNYSKENIKSDTISLNLVKKIEIDIINCLKIFDKFEQIISYDFNENELNKNEIKKWKKKLNVSSFCIEIIIHTITNIEKNIDSVINDENYSEEEELFRINFGSNEYINNIMKINYKNYEKRGDKKSKDYKKKKYFETEKKKNMKRIEDYDDNELENYYNNSKKDCVEYGLKSLEENIIVCTKYE